MEPSETYLEIKTVTRKTANTTRMNVTNSRAIPIAAATTTARPTCRASPWVSSEKLSES